jgi:hypothetical protein
MTDESKRQKSSTSSTNFAPRHLTAGELTTYALRVLNAWGCTVWRQNNHATRGRKFIGMKGVPDIIGHDLEGRAVYAEIKTSGDRLSQDQIDFMNGAAARDCRAYIVREESGQPNIEKWEDYRGITG